MTELGKDLSKILNDFQRIISKSYDNERSKKELCSMLNHLKNENEVLKENDRKYTEQIKTLRQICNEQVMTISELHDIKRKNEIFTEENNNLQNVISNLKEQIVILEIKNDETVQSYIFKHNVELKNKKDEFFKRERDLREKIEGLQASFDLEIYEKDNEKQTIQISFNEQLTKAADKEQQLKNEIFKLNNQLSSNTAVLQKKIHELEQKLKTAEREKSIFNISQGNFISANVANNVLKNYPQNNRNNNDNNFENESRNFVVRNEVRNVSQNIEDNTTKKFQFRKSNRSINGTIGKRLLNESFNPFELNKQINANNEPWKQKNSSKPKITTNSSNRDDIYDIIDNNSENSVGSVQENKLETNIDVDKEEKIEEQKNNSKNVSPTVKKRRLFNPKNMDYLNT